MSADHTADRYERLRQAFLAVCEVPTGEREAALDAACGGDDSLRAEVLALLAADAEDEAELDLAGLGGQVRGQLADLAAEDAAADAAPLPEHIGPYRILGEIGSGGMGRVLRAEQQGSAEHPETLGIAVAEQLLKQGAGDILAAVYGDSAQ